MTATFVNIIVLYASTVLFYVLVASKSKGFSSVHVNEAGISYHKIFPHN